MKFDILPCPFCGAKAILETNHRAFIGGEPSKVALVHCTKCNARSGRVEIKDYGKSSHSYEANVKAVELWNKRVEKEDK